MDYERMKQNLSDDGCCDFLIRQTEKELQAND